MQLRRALRPRRIAPQKREQRFGESCLLAGGESTRDATPENPPLGATQLVFWVRDFLFKKSPRLRDAPIINRETEAGTERKAEQVQPARFVNWTAPARLR